MHELGADQLVPSQEAAPESVWITEDSAPGGTAGYYEKKRVPVPHKILQHGRVAVFEFQAKGSFRIRVSHEPSFEANLERIVEIFQTLLSWILDGIVSWEEAFAGFRQDELDWWRVLRVPPDATPQEIEKGYRRQAAKRHPDKGGSHEAFLELQKAYRAAKAKFA